MLCITNAGRTACGKSAPWLLFSAGALLESSANESNASTAVPRAQSLPFSSSFASQATQQTSLSRLVILSHTHKTTRTSRRTVLLRNLVPKVLCVTQEHRVHHNELHTSEPSVATHTSAIKSEEHDCAVSSSARRAERRKRTRSCSAHRQSSSCTTRGTLHWSLASRHPLRASVL